MTGKHGSMVLLISGLPEGVQRGMLRELVQQACRLDRRGSCFGGRGCVKSCEIVRVTDRETQRWRLFGIVEVQPPKAATQVIARLDGALLEGGPINVHRHRHHSFTIGFKTDAVEQAGDGNDRSRFEQCRENLLVELVDESPMDFLSGIIRWFSGSYTPVGYP